MLGEGDCLQRVNVPCVEVAIGRCETCGKPICAFHGEVAGSPEAAIHCTTCVMLARHYAKPIRAISRGERDEYQDGAGRSFVGVWERSDRS